MSAMRGFKYLVEQTGFVGVLKPVGVKQAVEDALMLVCVLSLKRCVKCGSVIGIGDELPISPKGEWVENDPKRIGNGCLLLFDEA